jgi:hypothetical protein
MRNNKCYNIIATAEIKIKNKKLKGYNFNCPRLYIVDYSTLHTQQPKIDYLSELRMGWAGPIKVGP